MKLSQVLNEKKRGSCVMSISPGATLQEAVDLLCQNHIGALVVLNSSQEMVGIVSERDVLHCFCSAHQGSYENLRIEDIMTRDVARVSVDDTAFHALNFMNEKHVRHLPVFAGKDLVGIVSIGDILNSELNEDELKIHSLNDYLGGTYGSKVY
jgi:signal-transduction protein with cAMP-binding, CBS, and nucleotidyltransferase domain